LVEDTSSPETPDALEVTEDVELFSASSASSPSSTNIPTLGDLPEPRGLPTRLSGYPEEEPEERKEGKEYEEAEELEERKGEEELRKVYQQNQDIQRKLRRQNIIQLANGNYIQARPDGAGGVELVRAG
jgi:hypothetical protein